MATTTIARGARFLKYVEGAALLYAVLAGAQAALFTFVLVNSTSSGGGSALSLPVGNGPATIAAELSVPPYDVAHFTMVEFTATGLSTGATLLYFAPRALIPLIHLIVAFSIARFAAGARAERPFTDNLARSISVIAWSVALLGTLSQLCFSYGTSVARHELLADTDLYGGWLAQPGFDWTPLLVGLALGAVVIVLRAGERMQRDTVGLV